MGIKLVINAAGSETRVSLIENGQIVEYYLERKKERGIVGNVYKGRVVRVLPGMQAAFVDIGLDKAAFLYVSDVYFDPLFSDGQFELTEGEHPEHEGVPEELLEAVRSPAALGAASGADDEEAEVEPVTGELAAAVERGPATEAELAAENAGEGDAEGASEGEAEAASEGEAEAASEGEAEGASEGEAEAEAEAASDDEAEPEAEAPAEAAGESATESGSEVASAPAGEAAAAPSANGTEAPKGAEGGRPGKGEKDGKGQERSRRPEKGQRRRGDDRAMRTSKGGGKNGKPTAGRKEINIQDLLKEGQEVVVQVAKDPIGTKGARITSHISIPGRHLVFMPTVDHVGISRRIENEKERKRLRDIVDSLRPAGTGFIVRTVAEGVDEEKLKADIRFLIHIWNEVIHKKDKVGAPALLHPDLDIVLRSTRDLFSQDVEELIIDDRAEYDRILRFVQATAPELSSHVKLFDGQDPIFDAFGIEHELQRAQQRKVWLKSGGYLIIDQAEALTAIDVNSGRYVGKKSLEETITKINTEAAKEIVYQLRLRNIGGIVILDFIDMDKAQNRDKVFKALQEALGKDRAKTNVLKISELGLVEMTRKRVRESVTRMTTEACPYCEGRGLVKSKLTVAYEIFREIRREAGHFRESSIHVNCHPEVAQLLTGEEREELRELMDRFNKTIQVRPQQHYHLEQFDMFGRQEKKQEGGGGGREGRGSRSSREREAREGREPREGEGPKAG